MNITKRYKFFIHLIAIVYALVCILPLLMVLSISISNEADVARYGYSLVPKHLDFTAFGLLISNLGEIGRAYLITIISVAAPLICGTFIMALAGYVLSRPNFRYAKFFSAYFLITMLFSGGLIPTYIINTQYLGMGNNMLPYILLGWVTANNVFIFRTFFKQIDVALLESARIDGASELQVFIKIMMPMSKASFGSIGFFMALASWNDFTKPMYYITDEKLYNIQYYLQQIMQETEFLRREMMNSGIGDLSSLPTETMKFAICVIGTLPAIIIFPYFQKFFAKGMTLGGVKG